MFDQANIGNFTDKNLAIEVTRAGYTFVELLITLSLTSVIVLFFLQNYVSLQARFQSHLVLNHLVSLLQYARSEAIRMGKQVTLCKSRDGKSCSGFWRDGQIIFYDKNNRSQILRQYGPIKSGSLYFRAFQSSSFLRFTAKGMPFEQNGSFVYCPTQNPKLAHAIIIEKSGHIRFSQDNDRDGVDEDARGLPLSCRAIE
jgi:type IV fimbrial biogenesis protein FimT